MSEWFSNENVMSNPGVKDSNPYRLSTASYVKFAKEHKCLLQRSAFIYWESEIPSRINLGKRKYAWRSIHS